MARLMNIIVDILIVVLSAALMFYLALQSVTGAEYAGAGFQYGNQGLVATVVLLVIFILGMCRLVFDLRS